MSAIALAEGVAVRGSERILLVGATGLVGGMVARHWTRAAPRALRAVLQARRRGDCAAPDTLLWAPQDGPGPLIENVRTHGPIDAMVVLAGVTPRSGAPLDGNAAIAEDCLSAADAAGVPHVLIASSSAVYGAGQGGAFSEDDAIAPANDYGRAKSAMEDVCALYRARGTGVTCLRIGNVAGADALLLNAASATPEAPVRIDRFPGGGGPVRSYIGPATLARVIDTLVARAADLPPVLNIAAPCPIAMQALARAAGIPWVFTPAPQGAIEHVVLDCTRLAALHAFEPDDCDPAAMVSEVRTLKGRI